MTEWGKPDQDATQQISPRGAAYPGSYPPPPPAPYQGYTAPPVAPKNGLGTAALVLAIIALVSVFTVVGGLVLGILAVLLGIAGRGRVKREEATNGGVAVGGIALGILAIALSILFAAIWINLFQTVGGFDYVQCLKTAKDKAAVTQCETAFKQRVEKEFNVTLSAPPS